MTVKTITITEEAYNALKSQKGENESFSDIIKKISANNLKVKDLAGAIKMSNAEWAEFEKRIKNTREGLNEGLKKRLNYVHSGFISNN